MEELMADKKRGAAEKSAPKLAAHQQPVKRVKGAPPEKGGESLSDRWRAIEEKFGGDNPTDGLRARCGRRDVREKETQELKYVLVFVENVPAPEEVEEEFYSEQVVNPDAGRDDEARGKTHKVKLTRKVEKFDTAAVAEFTVGDRMTGVGPDLEAATADLEKKLGIGGDK